MDKLTAAQKTVLSFVKQHAKKHGYPPTRQEISDNFGWKSRNAAQQHLRLIENKGYLKLVSGGVSRGITILK